MLDMIPIYLPNGLLAALSLQSCCLTPVWCDFLAKS